MTVHVHFRSHRHLCPEADARDAMSDGEFWDHVFFQGEHPDEYDEEPPEVQAFPEPCPVCHEWGPCGYDAEGRILVHLVPPEDDE